MKNKKRKVILLESINENLNSVIENQERFYFLLAAIMDKLEKDQNVIIETASIEK